MSLPCLHSYESLSTISVAKRMEIAAASAEQRGQGLDLTAQRSLLLRAPAPPSPTPRLHLLRERRTPTAALDRNATLQVLTADGQIVTLRPALPTLSEEGEEAEVRTPSRQRARIRTKHAAEGD